MEELVFHDPVLLSVAEITEAERAIDLACSQAQLPHAVFQMLGLAFSCLLYQ